MPNLSTTISQVARCVDNAQTCTPAPASGIIKPADTIISWGATPVHTWQDIQQAIVDGGTAPTDVVVERNNTRQTLTVTPVIRESEDGSGHVVAKPFVGIGKN